eukprot:Skav225434  [mRNA]  locus=scaffold2854:8125:12401:+ [translate_table: standard]
MLPLRVLSLYLDFVLTYFGPCVKFAFCGLLFEVHGMYETALVTVCKSSVSAANSTCNKAVILSLTAICMSKSVR